MIAHPMVISNADNHGRTANSPRNILIVDDDPLVVRAMNVLLTQCAGFQPIVCHSGGEALKKIKPEIAAAVIDIHLPDINGLDLSQRLRPLMNPKAPIIILSGDHSMETIRALPEAGATYFFAKPVNGASLIEHLENWLEIKKPRNLGVAGVAGCFLARATADHKRTQIKAAASSSPGCGEKTRKNPRPLTSAAKLETQKGVRYSRKMVQPSSCTRVFPETVVLIKSAVPMTALSPRDVSQSAGCGSK